MLRFPGLTFIKNISDFIGTGSKGPQVVTRAYCVNRDCEKTSDWKITVDVSEIVRLFRNEIQVVRLVIWFRGHVNHKNPDNFKPQVRGEDRKETKVDLQTKTCEMYVDNLTKEILASGNSKIKMAPSLNVVKKVIIK